MEQKATNDIKDFVEDESIFSKDTLDTIKKMKDAYLKSEINLAKIYSYCYKLLEINLFKFKVASKDFTGEIEKLLANPDDKLLNLLESYGEGKYFGDYLVIENIKERVRENKKEHLKFIMEFMRLVGEEE